MSGSPLSWYGRLGAGAMIVSAFCFGLGIRGAGGAGLVVLFGCGFFALLMNRLESDALVESEYWSGIMDQLRLEEVMLLAEDSNAEDYQRKAAQEFLNRRTGGFPP